MEVSQEVGFARMGEYISSRTVKKVGVGTTVVYSYRSMIDRKTYFFLGTVTSFTSKTFRVKFEGDVDAFRTGKRSHKGYCHDISFYSSNGQEYGTLRSGSNSALYFDSEVPL